MRTTNLILALLMTVAIFSSCKKEVPKIGLLMDSFVHERWEKDRDLFKQKVTELGGEVLIEAAQGDANLQLKQAKKLIKEGVKVLVVVSAHSEKASKIVEFAHKNNVKVIAYDRLIKQCDLDYYVSTDNDKIGELQANYIISKIKKGNFALIGGSTFDHNAFMIREGQINILQPLVEKGDIKIIYDQYTERWGEDEGYTHALKILEDTASHVAAILAANDAIASGVIKALEEKELIGKVLVSGQDADLDACKKIINGKQTMTVYKPIKNIAYTAAELAINIATNKKYDPPKQRINNNKKLVPAILLNAIAVHKDNMKTTVIKDGFFTEKEIYE